MQACFQPTTLFKKETPAQVFSCEFCEIFKNGFFAEYLQTAASELFCRSSSGDCFGPLTFGKLGTTRIICLELFCKKRVLGNLGKHLCQSFFFNKVIGLQIY